MAEAHRLADALGGQWDAWINTRKIVGEIKTFALPILGSLARGEKLTSEWKAQKGWVSS